MSTDASKTPSAEPSPATSSSCIFCRIVAGEIPATILAETDRVIAFADLEPQAPTHALVIPRTHVANMGELADVEPETMADLITTARAVADEAGCDGYRLVANTGAQAHQTVFHAHLHVLGGRPMTWPPG